MKLIFPIFAVVFLLFGMISCKHESTQIQEKVATTLAVVEETDIDYNSDQWTELTTKDSFVIDIRYATANNFVKEPIYPCGRCFLRPVVAIALKKVNEVLVQQGYKLKLFDCYRPSPTQQILWNKVPDSNYVAPPWKGSMHSRGMTLDLTLTDMQGKEVDMGTPYDFFGPEAHPSYMQLSAEVLAHRKLLSDAMQSEGFLPIKTEWWHFTYGHGLFPLEDWQWPCKEKNEPFGSAQGK